MAEFNVEVNFNYLGGNTLIQCKNEDTFKDICEKYCTKLNIDINKLIFIYSGEMLNLELKLGDAINKIDKENLKMNVLVYDRNSTNINERIIKSKDIICPKCGELCLLNFEEYKIKLNECKNKHENIILLNEFENTQNINEDKIICNICNNNNKGKSYDNKFYICGTCNKNICLICKENHNKDHILIDYDNKNYLCYKHNEKFVSYCEICKEDLCMECDIVHNHKTISYKEIMPNIEKVKSRINEIKRIIDKFNNDIDEMIKILKNVKNNIENYYIINKNI
jgi:hypothetical protein